MEVCPREGGGRRAPAAHRAQPRGGVALVCDGNSSLAFSSLQGGSLSCAESGQEAKVAAKSCVASCDGSASASDWLLSPGFPQPF